MSARRISFGGALLALIAAFCMGPGAAAADEKAVFTKDQKAYYLSEKDLAFIRPGLVVTIVEASIDEEGVIRARFTATDPRGLPLDRNGVFTPGEVQTSFVVGVIPEGQSQYVSYITRNVASSDSSPNPNASALQATSDGGGTYEEVAQGEYIYTYGTRAPMGYDRGATHTVGVYARRDLTEFELGQPSNDATFNFVPDGSEITKVREIVATETCNRCHTNLTLHGRRHSIELCILCHTPQSTDPDSGNTVDFPVMIHKIHRGADLPSVQAGTPYQIIGFGGSVHDYSHVEFPADVRRCESCHAAGEATSAVAEPANSLRAPQRSRSRGLTASLEPSGVLQSQSGNYLTNPNRAACGSCHDDVNFATGENHADLPQVSDNQCARCHTPEGELEFDLSIIGAHTIPEFSKELRGVNFEILGVTESAPGQNPTVTFTVHDDAGVPIAPSDMNRLRLLIAGNTTDISRYWMEDAIGAEGSNGTYRYTFEQPIPEDAQGSWTVGIEGRTVQTLLEGTQQERPDVQDLGENKVFHFRVTDGESVPRRKVVAQERCESCHAKLRLHGNNRSNVEYCVLCHNPLNTDAEVRPEEELPAETINFKQLIHKIHTGEEIDESRKPYVIFGFRSSRHEFSEVLFPGDRRKCSICHEDGTEQLPLSEGQLTVQTPRDYLTAQPPISGACLSCHTSLSAAAHADLQISPNLGESCAVCHGPTADFSIDRVHAQ
jgi:hypothetical protein